jgi:ComF family protein
MTVAAAPGRGTVRWPWRYRTRQVVWAAVDIVFPPACAGCGRPGQRFCAACQSRLAVLTPPFCDTCGYPVETAGRCQLCRTGVNAVGSLAGIRSAAFFDGPLQQAIHQFKYHRDAMLADILAAVLLAAGPSEVSAASLVVAVPLAPERLRERGYNQAALLARAYSELHGLRGAPFGARRVRNTESQVGLSARQRRLNVAGAFEGDRRMLDGEPIILIDDVCTTGATLDSCAAALLAAGATQVWGLTLARARLPQARL